MICFHIIVKGNNISTYFFECKDRAFRPIYSQFPKTALNRIIANGYTLKRHTEASNWPIQKWNLRKFDKGNLRVLPPGHDWRLLLDAITEPRPISRSVYCYSLDITYCRCETKRHFTRSNSTVKREQRYTVFSKEERKTKGKLIEQIS